MGALNHRRGKLKAHQALSSLLLLPIISLILMAIGNCQSTITQSESRKDHLLRNQIRTYADASAVQGEEDGVEQNPRSTSPKTGPSGLEGISSSGWSQLNLVPKEIASTQFESFRVNIFNHTRNQGRDSPENRYFYAPISLFNFEDTACTAYPDGKSHEVVLSITMWNDKSQRLVAGYLNNRLCSMKGTGANQCLILDDNVEVIPFDEVRLVATNAAKKKFFGCTVDSAWRPYQAQRLEEFTLSCPDEEKCKSLALQMQKQPQKFQNHLQVALRLTSSTKSMQTRSIRVTNLVRNKLAAAIDEQFSKKQQLETALLTSADYEEFMQEAAKNVALDTFDNSEDIVDDWTLENVMKILKKFLTASTAWTSRKAGESAWESVFWREEDYRPDKSAATLNDIHKELNTNRREQLQTVFSNKHSGTSTKSTTTRAGIETFPGSHTANEALVKEMAERANTSTDKTWALLAKSKDYVKWDGVKFAPKDMELTGVNLANLRDTKYLSNQKVQVRNTPIVLSTPIHLPAKESNELNDESVQERVGAMILDERSESSLNGGALKALDRMEKVIDDRLTALEDKFKKSALMPALESRLGFVEAITMQNIPRTCHDLKNMGVVKSGDYLIDPDGSGFGDAPFTAHCDLESGVTVIEHDAMDAVDVRQCRDPGCHVTVLSYKASMKQILSLTALSNECHQEMRYDCLSAPLSVKAWWLGGASKEPNFFWDADHKSDDHTCACAGASGANNECLNASYPCNCDAGLPEWHFDVGTLTDKSRLPVTELRFGGFIFDSQEAKFHLGPLRCSGRQAFVATESCATLQLAGHVGSGYYFVDGSRGGDTLDLVRCNMQQSDEPADVRQVPTAFRVPKSARVAFFAERNDGAFYRSGDKATVIPYDQLPVNDGDAMTLAGTFTAPVDGVYFFSLHHGPHAWHPGWRNLHVTSYAYLAISVDGEVRVNLHGMQVKGDHPKAYTPVGGDAVFKLKAGQTVESMLRREMIAGPVYFTGHLMYPL